MLSAPISDHHLEGSLSEHQCPIGDIGGTDSESVPPNHSENRYRNCSRYMIRGARAQHCIVEASTRATFASDSAHMTPTAKASAYVPRHAAMHCTASRRRPNRNRPPGSFGAHRARPVTARRTRDPRRAALRRGAAARPRCPYACACVYAMGNAGVMTRRFFEFRPRVCRINVSRWGGAAEREVWVVKRL